MRIEPLTSTSPYLDGAGDVLTSTFANEYICKALLGDAGNGDEIAYRRYRHTLTHAVLDLDASVAIDDSEPEGAQVAGLMLVKDPGIDMAKTPNVDTEHKRAVAVIAPPEVMTAIKDLNDIEHRLEQDTWGPTGTNDIYFLHFLCTASHARGKGVAHQLLTPLLERVQKEGAEIGLITHTEENVKYYERYGFRVRAASKDSIRGSPIHYWSMSKP